MKFSVINKLTNYCFMARSFKKYLRNMYLKFKSVDKQNDHLVTQISFVLDRFINVKKLT